MYNLVLYNEVEDDFMELPDKVAKEPFMDLYSTLKFFFFDEENYQSDILYTDLLRLNFNFFCYN